MKNKTDKKDFKLYLDSLSCVDEMTNEEAGELLKAFISYWKEEQPEFKTGVKFAYKIFEAQFNRDWESYLKTCKARAEAGSLGGKQKVANASNCKQNLANLADTDTENDTDKDKDNNTLVPLTREQELFALIETWNNRYISTKYHKNTSIRTGDNIMMKCNGCTPDLLKQYKKLRKSYSMEQFESAFDAYAIHRTTITPQDGSDYHEHKFSLFEFLVRKGGFINFVNR